MRLVPSVGMDEEEVKALLINALWQKLEPVPLAVEGSTHPQAVCNGSVGEWGGRRIGDDVVMLGGDKG